MTRRSPVPVRSAGLAAAAVFTALVVWVAGGPEARAQDAPPDHVWWVYLDDCLVEDLGEGTIPFRGNAISPDSRYVRMTTDQGVVHHDVKTGEQTPAPAGLISPDWSAIVTYGGFDETDATKVTLTDYSTTDGAGTSRSTDIEFYDATQGARWSPDGRYVGIYMENYQGTDDGEMLFDHGLNVVKDYRGRWAFSVWSPDSTRILQPDFFDDGGQGLYLDQIGSSGEPRQILPGRGLVVWRADSQRLFYVEAGDSGRAPVQAITLEADGSVTREDLIPLSEGVWFQSFLLSPDEKQAAARAMVPDPEGSSSGVRDGTHLINTETGAHPKITDDDSVQVEAWTKDGRMIWRQDSPADETINQAYFGDLSTGKGMLLAERLFSIPTVAVAPDGIHAAVQNAAEPPCVNSGGTPPQGAVKAAGKPKAGKPLKLSVTSNEPGLAIANGIQAQTSKARKRGQASGSARVSGGKLKVKLTKSTTRLEPGEPAKLKLKPRGKSGKRAAKQLRRAVKAGAKAKAKITVTFKDPAGNTSKEKLSFGLK